MVNLKLIIWKPAFYEIRKQSKRRTPNLHQAACLYKEVTAPSKLPETLLSYSGWSGSGPEGQGWEYAHQNWPFLTYYKKIFSCVRHMLPYILLERKHLRVHKGDLMK